MVTAGSGRESGPESAVCGAEVSGVPSNIYVGWSTTTTVVVVSRSQRESWCSTAEPFGGTRRLSLDNVVLAVSFFGLARSNVCLSGRLSSELGRVSLDPAD